MSAEQHASPIKTPQQLITVIVLSFVVPVAVIILLATYVTGGKREAAGSNSMSPEAIADRLRPVGSVVLASAGAGPRALQSGEAVYKLACGACHTAGVAGAPKSGDEAAWKPRLAQGFDTLVKHAVEGFKTMPAKGGNASLDPIEVARAVAYMGNQVGGKFTEPAAPAAAPAAAAAPNAPNAPTAPTAPSAAAPAAAAVAAASVAAAAATSAPAATKVDAAVGEKLYLAACTACHMAGVAGAPRTGDKAAWAPRLALGVDGLTQSVLKGKGAMPPRGAAANASDADIRAAVEFMLAKVK
ncbi:MAG: c-type cytochrome [Burkholderiaceae bacterium]|jgi:cytochrome c5|nr:c-type cytochrome [Burkholderiaceae bacterium]